MTEVELPEEQRRGMGQAVVVADAGELTDARVYLWGPAAYERGGQWCLRDA